MQSTVEKKFEKKTVVKKVAKPIRGFQDQEGETLEENNKVPDQPIESNDLIYSRKGRKAGRSNPDHFSEQESSRVTFQRSHQTGLFRSLRLIWSLKASEQSKLIN
jgi:hypothetical protein